MKCVCGFREEHWEEEEGRCVSDEEGTFQSIGEFLLDNGVMVFLLVCPKCQTVKADW